ncbi:ketoacyl-ACP synthase III [Shewanella alkalitolerans]|uniref:ketoacyl-ACP synthase III n=1 Tax=Shewanella alkalitolerans TaxID=2864209 RepID=UPI001C657C9C|nr:ketoacyl-ACP synthase III [Shewanella alkalitolerans]QYJ98953.1 ketoacyl-ACP synthase III [Shewanella alkalitolerans]
MKSNIGNISLKGILAAVPRHVSNFDDEIKNYSHTEQSSKKLKKLMGYDQHHIVSKETALTDMIIPLLEELPVTLGCSYKDIDAIFVVTQTPDYPIPSTASILHGAFDFKTDCYCIDINDGCNGYIRGLFEASSLIRNSDAKKVLLIAGDVLSRKVSLKDRNSYPLIGDAVTVTLIEKRSKCVNAPLEIKHDGKGAKALMIPSGGMVRTCSLETAILAEDTEGNWRSPEQLVMQGRDVFTFTQTTVINFIKEFVNTHSKLEEIDLFFFHQANKFILDRFRTALKVNEEQLPSEVIAKYGNSSSATVPMSIVLSWGNHSGFLGKKALLSGFGIGLSWGAALIEMNELAVCKLIEMDV